MFANNIILGRVLSKMEGLQWWGQHLGAGRESRLSRPNPSFWGSKEKERSR